MPSGQRPSPQNARAPLALTCRGAARHGRPVGVCGGLASDPAAAALLVGLGVTELSCTPAAVHDVKAAIRQVDLAACRKLASAALPSLAGARAPSRELFAIVGLACLRGFEDGSPGARRDPDERALATSGLLEAVTKSVTRVEAHT